MADDRDKFESWKNVTQGRVYLLRTDRLTGLTKHELVNSGRTFQITPHERRLNQENAANDELDIFSNGILCPVRLIDDEDDAREIASNPQHLSDTDMVELFAAHYRTFEKRVAAISNTVTLERLRAVGEEQNATVKQMAVIKARLEELTPDHQMNSEPVDVGPRLVDGAGFKPVTP